MQISNSSPKQKAEPRPSRMCAAGLSRSAVVYPSVVNAFPDQAHRGPGPAGLQFKATRDRQGRRGLHVPSEKTQTDSSCSLHGAASGSATVTAANHDLLFGQRPGRGVRSVLVGFFPSLFRFRDNCSSDVTSESSGRSSLRTQHPCQRRSDSSERFCKGLSRSLAGQDCCCAST